MRLEDYITITPGVRSGKPCIKGTRIAVYDILEYLAGGMSQDQLLADFPDLKPDHSGPPWPLRQRASAGWTVLPQREVAL